MKVCFAVLVLMLPLAASASDWPAFRGSNGTAASADAKPPAKWSAKENLKWTAPLPGPGSSSPIVVGDKVFVTYYTGYGTPDATASADKLVRHLACLDRANGKVKWTADVPSTAAEDRYTGYIREHGYASHTPVSDGEAVYVFFGKSGVLAFDLTGKKLWQTSVGTQSDIRGWGSGASPVLYGKLVIVNASSESRAVVALDKATGKVVWKESSEKLSLSFGSPALVKAGADRTDLVVAMPGAVWGLNPDTGKQLWTTAIKPDGNISPAVIAGDGLAYIYGGYQTKGSVAIKVGGSGDVKPEWSARSSSYVPTPALADGKLYCVTDEGLAQCVNAADGKVIYEERLPMKGAVGKGSKPIYASAVVADEKIYAVSRRGGTYVLKAGGQYELLEQNPPLDDTDFNATPAVAGSQLFLRSNKAVYCIE